MTPSVKNAIEVMKETVSDLNVQIDNLVMQRDQLRSAITVLTGQEVSVNGSKPGQRSRTATAELDRRTGLLHAWLETVPSAQEFSVHDFMAASGEPTHLRPKYAGMLNARENGTAHSPVEFEVLGRIGRYNNYLMS